MTGGTRLFARLGLIVTWGLFAAWVGWLAWQSIRHDHSPVVSRAQLLTADIAVTADLTANADNRPSTKIKVSKVVWPDGAPNALEGREIEIANLPSCDRFNGAGRYVLILSGQGEGPYRVAELPRSPLIDPRARPSLYSETPEVLAQLREVRKAKGG